MIYREYLVMRKALAWYAGVVVILILVQIILSQGVQFTQSRSTGVDWGSSTAMTAGIFSACFAWLFGVALGNGSREAARTLWVLPADRWKTALQLISVDLAGITVAFACEYAVMLLSLAVSHMRFGTQVPFTVSAGDVIPALVLAYSVYGWSALVGMIGRRMPYGGLLSAPALVLWFTLAQLKDFAGAVLRAPIVANPIAVSNTEIALVAWKENRFAVDTVSTSLQWLGTAWEMPLLILIAAATCGLAVALWQKAEAI